MLAKVEISHDLGMREPREIEMLLEGRRGEHEGLYEIVQLPPSGRPGVVQRDVRNLTIESMAMLSQQFASMPKVDLEPFW